MKKPLVKKAEKKVEVKKVVKKAVRVSTRKKTTKKPKQKELSLQEFFDKAKKERHLIVFFTLDSSGNQQVVLQHSFRNQWPHGKTIVCANLIVTALRKVHEKETGKLPW